MAKAIDEFCYGVTFEIYLQPLQSESFDIHAAVTDVEAKLDINAYGPEIHVMRHFLQWKINQSARKIMTHNKNGSIEKTWSGRVEYVRTKLPKCPEKFLIRSFSVIKLVQFSQQREWWNTRPD